MAYTIKKIGGAPKRFHMKGTKKEIKIKGATPRLQPATPRPRLQPAFSPITRPSRKKKAPSKLDDFTANGNSENETRKTASKKKRQSQKSLPKNSPTEESNDGSEVFQGSQHNDGPNIYNRGINSFPKSALTFGGPEQQFTSTFGGPFGLPSSESGREPFNFKPPRHIRISRGRRTAPLVLTPYMLQKLKADKTAFASVFAGVGTGSGAYFYPKTRSSRFSGRRFPSLTEVKKSLKGDKRKIRIQVKEGAPFTVDFAFSGIEPELSVSGINFELFKNAANDLLEFLVANEEYMAREAEEIQLAVLPEPFGDITTVHSTTQLNLPSVTKGKVKRITSANDPKYKRGEKLDGRGGESGYRDVKITADVNNGDARNDYMKLFFESVDESTDETAEIPEDFSMLAALSDGLYAIKNPEGAVCCHTVPSSPDLDLPASCSSQWIDLCVASENYVVHQFGLFMKRVPFHFFGDSTINSSSDTGLTNDSFGPVAKFEFFSLFKQFSEVLRAQVISGTNIEVINDGLRRFKMDMFHVFRTLKICTCFLITSLEVKYTKKETARFTDKKSINVKNAATHLGSAMFQASITKNEYIDRIVKALSPGRHRAEENYEGHSRAPILATLSGAAMYRLKDLEKNAERKAELKQAWTDCKFDSTPEEFAESLVAMGKVMHTQLAELLNKESLAGGVLFNKLVGENDGKSQFDEFQKEDRAVAPVRQYDLPEHNSEGFKEYIMGLSPEDRIKYNEVLQQRLRNFLSIMQNAENQQRSSQRVPTVPEWGSGFSSRAIEGEGPQPGNLGVSSASALDPHPGWYKASSADEHGVYIIRVIGNDAVSAYYNPTTGTITSLEPRLP